MKYTRFEWDEAKSRANIRKHGISFTTAASLFSHPHAIHLDTRGDHEEDRWIAVGWIGPVIGLLIFTERDERLNRIIRIISARKASAREAALYEKEFRH